MASCPIRNWSSLRAEIGTPLYQIQEVASFFPHFRQEWNKPARVEVKVCRDMSCHLAGAAEPHLLADRWACSGNLAARKASRVVVEGTSCLGRCDRAPAVCISRHVHTKDGVDHEKSFHDRVYAGMSEKDLKMTLEAVIRGDDPPPEDTPDLARNIDPRPAGKSTSMPSIRRLVEQAVRR